MSTAPPRTQYRWVLTPAVVLLVLLAVVVATLSQTPVPQQHGGPSNDEMMTREGSPLLGTNFSTATAAVKQNATDVLNCLSDKCDPLLDSLAKSWKELANIQLLRCLASSAVNKTAASVCFEKAKPGEMRDDLVACAGCNGCIQLKNQTSIDKACAKYKAWSDKKKAEAASTVAIVEPFSRGSALLDGNAASSSPSADAEGTTDSLPAPSPSQLDGLLAALPKELKESFCSQYWCP